MLFMLEVSRPLQKKPWHYRSRINRRFGWLWFAFSIHHMREDQLLKAAARGDIVLDYRYQSEEESDYAR